MTTETRRVLRDLIAKARACRAQNDSTGTREWLRSIENLRGLSRSQIAAAKREVMSAGESSPSESDREARLADILRSRFGRAR